MNTATAPSASVVRGGLLLLLAKGINILAGFALYFVLAAVLHSQLGAEGAAAFGAFTTALAVINPINMMFAQGTLTLVSRLVAERSHDPGGAFAACVRLQLPLVVAFGVGWQFAVPAVAEGLLHDEAYVPILRVGGAVPLLYAARCLYQGWCNGRRSWRGQSAIDTGASLGRMVGVIGGAALGASALAAMGGFVLAAVAVLAVTAVFVRPTRPTGAERPRPRQLFALQGQILLATFATYLLMSLDQIAVKALAHAEPAVADRWAGFYAGGARIAQIPYGLVTAMIWVLFPLVAQRAASGEGRELAQTLRGGLRIVLLLLAPAAAALAGSAEQSFSLVFPGPAAAAARFGDDSAVVWQPLALLGPAYLLFGLLTTGATLLTAAGRAGVASLILAASALVSRLLTTAWVPEHGPLGAAAGSAVAWGLGLLAVFTVLSAAHGPPLGARLLLRVTLACGALLAVGWAVPARGPALLAEHLLQGVVYLVVLVLTGELGRADFERLRGALRPMR